MDPISENNKIYINPNSYNHSQSNNHENLNYSNFNNNEKGLKIDGDINNNIKL